MDTITVQDKKDFIRWFLNEHQLKRRECVWILNYITSHDVMVEKLHFVEDVQYTPRGMRMSTHSVEDVPFRYYYEENSMTTDAEKSFHDIRLNKDRDLYLEIQFLGREKSSEWYNVLENNKFAPLIAKQLNEDKLAVDSLIENIFHNQKIADLDRKIDEALMAGDRKAFKELSAIKRRMTVVKPRQLYQIVKR